MDEERRHFIEGQLRQAREIRARSFSPNSLKTNTERFNNQFHEYINSEAEWDAMLMLASLAPVGKAVGVGFNLTKDMLQQGIKRLFIGLKFLEMFLIPNFLQTCRREAGNLLREALDKVDPKMGIGEPINKGQGIKWSDGEKGNIVPIRMRNGDPMAPHPKSTS